jgi:tripartite-type tricarboxylate transporter receptor subunit TctC
MNPVSYIPYAWLSAAALILALFSPSALAQGASSANFPARAVRLVVAFPPGGATDVIARTVAQKLSDSWGQPVLVDNRAGATGAVGSELVAKAVPDGYTILMGTASTHSVAPAVNPKLPYDNQKDFAPISLVATFPNMLVVHPSLPVKNISEFIAYLKANPGKVNFASSGTGGSVHLAGELFKLMTKTDMVHIPYKGSAPALAELLAGQVQCEFDNMTTVFPYVQAGRLRALGVAGLERSPAAPDVPAIAEVLPGFEANSWVGLFAPAATPAAIVGKIAADVRRVLRVPELEHKLGAMGAVAVGSDPGSFAAFVKRDTERWRGVVRAAQIKPE